MYEESDLIQSISVAHIERIILEQSINVIQRTQGNTKKVLSAVVAQYALSYLETHMTWYLTAGVLSKEQAKAVSEKSRELTATLGNSIKELVACFGIPQHLLFAPIANDWVKFNAFDNQGEIISNHAKL
jgi:acyl-CoA oxidase